MTNTHDIIARLSAEANTAQPIAAPRFWVMRLLAVSLAYMVAIQLCLGIRPDLAEQLTRPFFVAEIIALLFLVVSSLVAAIYAMYPDAYQKPKHLLYPYLAFGLLVCVVVLQLFMPHDERMMMPAPGAHAMECALCISSVALIPSALIFALLRKGASIHPLQAGVFAVLAASAMGCLTLRFAEANDSIVHLLQWHYVPTFLFAALGALVGKYLLRW